MTLVKLFVWSEPVVKKDQEDDVVLNLPCHECGNWEPHISPFSERLSSPNRSEWHLSLTGILGAINI